MPNGEASLQFVTVGGPGNAADPATGSLYGSVGYTYQMGEYDVTVGQYCQFLYYYGSPTGEFYYVGFRVASVPTGWFPQRGDANADGRVDINDLTIVLTNYGKTGATWTQGEFTGSGTVDINDLSIVLANFGQTAGSPAAMIPAPEPSAIALLLAGAACLAAFAWRRRA